jgi:hypothetical protein
MHPGLPAAPTRPLPRCGKEIIVVCDFGGSNRQPEERRQSQSLKAAYYSKRAGYTNVLFMKVAVFSQDCLAQLTQLPVVPG